MTGQDPHHLENTRNLHENESATLLKTKERHDFHVSGRVLSWMVAEKNRL